MAIVRTALYRTKTRHQQVIENRIGEPIDQALHRLYIVDRLDQAEIGERWGLEQSTVSRWLKDFGISRI